MHKSFLVLGIVALGFGVLVVPPYIYGTSLLVWPTPARQTTFLSLPPEPQVFAQLRHRVNRELKGDRLTQETLTVQYQGLMPDGTPVEEYEFHREEALSSMVAKNNR